MKKYPIKARLRCPTCSGKGYVEISNSFLPNIGRSSERFRELRNEIRKNKERFSTMTLRAIASELNIKHPQTIKNQYIMIQKIGWDIEE